MAKTQGGVDGPKPTAANKKTTKAPEDDSRKKAAEEIHKQLHDKPQKIGSYKFNKVKVGSENLDESVSKILQRYSVDESKVEKTSQKFFDEWKKQKKEIESLQWSLGSRYQPGSAFAPGARVTGH